MSDCPAYIIKGDKIALLHPSGSQHHLAGLYNLTTGIWVTYREILDALTGLVPKIQVAATASGNREPSSEGDDRGPLSGHRLFHDLDWTPKFDLNTGLTDYLQWQRDSSILD